MQGLEETVNHIKTELMPDYDYDEYTRRHEEWEAKQLEEQAAEAAGLSGTTSEPVSETTSSTETEVDEEVEVDEDITAEVDSSTSGDEDDMSW